jgi:hypothetical protein
MAMSNDGEDAKHLSLLDKGKDIILKSTPDGLFTIDRALKAEKHSTILASVVVYASSLAIFLVLLLFELRRATESNDVRIVKAPESLTNDGYTCEGLKTNVNFRTFGKDAYRATTISANIDYSATTNECRSAVGDAPCTELYDAMYKNAIGKGMNVYDSYPKICGFQADTYRGGMIDSGYYNTLFGEGAYDKDSAMNSKELEAKYLEGIKTAAAAAKCPGLTIDFSTGSRSLSQSLQMSSTMQQKSSDNSMQESDDQYIYIKENGLNGISVFMTVFDLTPTAAPTLFPTPLPYAGPTTYVTVNSIPTPPLGSYPGSPKDYTARPYVSSVPSYVEQCDEVLRAVCESATSLSAPFACTKTSLTYPTFFEAFGVAYPNTLAYISAMFILLSLGLPMLRPPPADEKEEEKGDKSEKVEEKKRKMKKKGGRASDTSTADFSFEMAEVYDNPLAAGASEDRRYRTSKV